MGSDGLMNTVAVDSDLRFLGPDRIGLIGQQAAEMLMGGLGWIERRKEVVSVLDEVMLRRCISVEFRLTRSVRPIPTAPPNLVENGSAGSCSGGRGEAQLYGAPVYVLPKNPSGMMAFDLTDEAGSSLRLFGREDNAQISAAVIVAMAQMALEEVDADLSLSSELAAALRRVALAPADDGERLAVALLGPVVGEHRRERALRGVRTFFADLWRRGDEVPSGQTTIDDAFVVSGEAARQQLKLLADRRRFAWWLRTFAHSSLVVVPFRAANPGRKLVKLTFHERSVSDKQWGARLGWAPHRLVIDAPFVSARSFHFEASAPPGLQIFDAAHAVAGTDELETSSGPAPHVHLYRSRAERSGGGTAVLSLRTSFNGLAVGALPAALGVSVALLACALTARGIAGSSGDPTLLLLLPGLIATYVARPDVHGLTTRMLSGVRLMLIAAAVLAYGGAALVVLGGEPLPPIAPDRDAIIAGREVIFSRWLWVLFWLSLVPVAVLSVAWVTSLLQLWGWHMRLGLITVGRDVSSGVLMDDESLTDAAAARRYERLPHPGPGDGEHDLATEFYDSVVRGTWVLTVRMIAAPDGGLPQLRATSRYEPAPWWPFQATRRQCTAEVRRVTEMLDELAGVGASRLRPTS